ncbi:MAG: nucleotide pyrophosphohydrolase [Lachnospiraceae bacterium]|nr:nucleotide pyrophosphohydrolase [Lachnospiraceae bacterium]
MDNFSFQEMQAIQKQLQEKYKDKWRPLSPEIGKDQLLYLLIELGEVADVMKKSGNQKIMEDTEVRKHFIEEMCDVLLYFNDVMLCYDISIEELKTVYLQKHKRNMERW